MNRPQKFLNLVTQAKQEIQEISVEKAKAFIQETSNLVIIDVREEYEWLRGRLPDSIHLSKGVLERDIENIIPDMTQPLLLYCGGGYRSALAALNLQKMGYEKVVSMDGGFGGWVNAGLPVEN
jgi:rhodanese-related sulfurtransferase